MTKVIDIRDKRFGRLIVIDWAKEINIPYSRLFARIKRGWSIEKALND